MSENETIRSGTQTEKVNAEAGAFVASANPAPPPPPPSSRKKVMAANERMTALCSSSRPTEIDGDE